MRPTGLPALAAALFVAIAAAGPAMADWTNRFEVFGVAEEDMLKMRAGPGTGFVVLLGLPNGTLVRIQSCQLIGGTNWCKVHLDGAPALKGYVSHTYLREKP
jgi:uncharacterized protein YraI